MRLFGDTTDAEITEEDRAGFMTPPFDGIFPTPVDVEAPMSEEIVWRSRTRVFVTFEGESDKPVNPYRRNSAYLDVEFDALRVLDVITPKQSAWTGTLAAGGTQTFNLHNWTDLFGRSSQSFATAVTAIGVFNIDTGTTAPALSFGPKTPNPYGAGVFGSSADRLVIQAGGCTVLGGSFLGTTGTRKNVILTNLDGVATCDYLLVVFGAVPLAD